MKAGFSGQASNSSIATVAPRPRRLKRHGYSVHLFLNSFELGLQLIQSSHKRLLNFKDVLVAEAFRQLDTMVMIMVVSRVIMALVIAMVVALVVAMIVAFMTVVVVTGLTWNLHHGLGPIVEPHINAVQLAFNLGQLGS